MASTDDDEPRDDVEDSQHETRLVALDTGGCAALEADGGGHERSIVLASGADIRGGGGGVGGSAPMVPHVTSPYTPQSPQSLTVQVLERERCPPTSSFYAQVRVVGAHAARRHRSEPSSPPLPWPNGPPHHPHHPQERMVSQLMATVEAARGGDAGDSEPNIARRMATLGAKDGKVKQAALPPSATR